MRILHLSDTHLGTTSWVRGAPRDYRRSLDHERALLAALDPAMRGRVDLVVHTGDLFDRSRPPEAAVRRLSSILSNLARRVPVVLMPGNHDRRGIRHNLPTHLPNVHVFDRAERLDIAGVRLGIVPYVGDADGWATAAERACRGGVDLLLSHQAFHGAVVPGFTFRESQQVDTIAEQHLPRGVKWILCGHIHPRQAIRLGEATVVHPGSTERTAFSERLQPKGYVLWTLDGPTRWRFVDLPTRKMVVVGVEDHLADVTPGCLVRITPDLNTTELEEEVMRRGGWLCGPPPEAAPVARRPRPPKKQLKLWQR